MTADARRFVAGQLPGIAGAVAVGDTVWTSGVVSSTAMTSQTTVEVQVREAVSSLLEILADVGCTPADVVKLDAYLADPADFHVWNKEYQRYWSPERPPARTTTVCGFMLPTLRFELSAVAVRS